MSFRWLNYPNKCLNRIDVDVLTKRRRRRRRNPSKCSLSTRVRTHVWSLRRVDTYWSVYFCSFCHWFDSIDRCDRIETFVIVRFAQVSNFSFLLSFNLVWFNRWMNKKSYLCHQTIICFLFLLVSPELTIQMSLARTSSQILLTCSIIARPLALAKWKHNHRDLSNVKRIEINDFTYQLSVLLPVRISFNERNQNENWTIFSSICLQIDLSNLTRIFGTYECIAENQLKFSKSFVVIDGLLIFDWHFNELFVRSFVRSSIFRFDSVQSDKLIIAQTNANIINNIIIIINNDITILW